MTGYGLIDVDGMRNCHVASGCIKTVSDAPLAERLQSIYRSVTEVIAHYQPQEVAAEQVFMHRNADSALKLGQARGVALCAAAMAGLPISEYAPRAIKQAVTGSGAAEKMQVQRMVALLLNLSELPPSDAADALAVALCHAHTRQTVHRLNLVQLPRRRGRR